MTQTTPCFICEEQDESQLVTHKVRRKPTHFVEEIMQGKLPSSFRATHLGEYDGSVDPE